MKSRPAGIEGIRAIADRYIARDGGAPATAAPKPSGPAIPAAIADSPDRVAVLMFLSGVPGSVQHNGVTAARAQEAFARLCGLSGAAAVRDLSRTRKARK